MQQPSALIGSLLIAVGAIGLLLGHVAPGRAEAAWPLPRASQRPMLLTFGLYVTPDPAQNPIDPPERFTGYHTALDFEMLPGEENREVPVTAICGGEVLRATWAEGYGGVLVHRCMLGGNDMTVLYGHLDASSFTKKPGEQVERGERIGVLAGARSSDSDDTRKHLHLAIHRGTGIEMLGYVQNEQALLRFIDPLTVLPRKWSLRRR